MAVTGLTLTEKRSGGSKAPEGQEYKQALIAEHATQRGFYMLDITSKPVELFGTGALAEELTVLQANSNSNLSLMLYLVPPGEIKASNIAAQLDELMIRDKVSTIGFLKDVDATFIEKAKLKVAALESNKIYVEIITCFRKAPKIDLKTVIATQSAGSLTIPWPNNGLKIGDEVLICKADRSAQISGRFPLTAADATGVTISSTEPTFTFEAGATIEEHPDDYCLDVADQFGLVESSSISSIYPTTENNWLGAYMGRVSRCKVHTSPGKVMDGGLIGVNVNPNYTHAHFKMLDSARGVFFKRFVENETEVHVNDDNVFFSTTDDVKTLAQRRVLNKAKRQTLFYGFKLINDDAYTKDEAGATAASLIVAMGLKVMKEVNNEISDYSLKCSWTTTGLAVEMTIVDKFRIKHVLPTLILTEQDATSAA